MNRVALIGVTFLLLFGDSLLSNPVDMEKARIVAQNFMGKSRSTSKSVSDVVTEKFEGQNSIYVVNFREGGWVMVSADDAAVPVLAFSNSNTYRTEDEKPDGFLFLVSEYMEQINMVKKTEPVRSSEVMEMWNSLMMDDGKTDDAISQKSIAATSTGTYTPGSVLLNIPGRGHVAWNQDRNNENGCDPGYNKFAPQTAIQGWFGDCDCYDRPPIGCGAVAMGQVMWYWQWPKTSPYRTYNWDLMPYALTNSSTQAEGDEIANLLRDCGRASNMTYACLGSFTTQIEEAMTNSFDYMSIRKVYKNDWDGNVWNDLIRTEIDCGRPVIYYGAKAWTVDKRHYFIIDGYHAYIPNYFHINFGWRGSYDYEHFYLGDITPGTNNYNSNQYAIIGISPTYPHPDRVNVTDLSIFESLSLARGRLTVEAQQNISLPAPGKSLVVENGVSLTLVAGNSITMNPGFKVEPGGTFKTKIEPSYAGMEIAVSSWPSQVYCSSSDILTISASNANSFDFTVSDDLGNIYHQSAGLVSNGTAVLCAGNAVPPGISSCTIRLRNNYGRTLEYTWDVEFVLLWAKSSTGSDTTNNYIDEFPAPASDLTETPALTEDDITIYPNPNSGTVNISIVKPFSGYNIRVYDMSGTLVYEDRKVTQSSYSFDMGSVANGTYTVQIETANSILSKKLIMLQY